MLSGFMKGVMFMGTKTPVELPSPEEPDEPSDDPPDVPFPYTESYEIAFPPPIPLQETAAPASRQAVRSGKSGRPRHERMASV